MNAFERFKNRNAKHGEAAQEINTHFILNGYPSIKLHNGNSSAWLEDVKRRFVHTWNNEQIAVSVLPTEIQAAVVNQQEKDKAYVYTLLDTPLPIGSIWGAKTLYWLIAEELITIKDVKWHKYLGYLCNIQIEDTWGYFIGPEKHYVNIVNENNASLESLQKPVLVLPEGILGFKDKIVINNRPWQVQEWDAISSPGLIYYSLRATTISKEVAEEHAGEEVYIEHIGEETTPIIITPETEEGRTVISNNVNITVSTEEGYFKSDKKVVIKAHTATQVIFSIPFGITEVTIQTKQQGEVVSTTYNTDEND